MLVRLEVLVGARPRNIGGASFVDELYKFE